MKFGNPFSVNIVDIPQILLSLTGFINGVASGYTSPIFGLQNYQSFVLNVACADPAATPAAPTYATFIIDWTDSQGIALGSDLYEINAVQNFTDGSGTLIEGRIKSPFMRIRTLTVTAGNILSIVLYGSSRIWAGPPWIVDSPTTPSLLSSGVDNVVTFAQGTNPVSTTKVIPGRFLSGPSSTYFQNGAQLQAFTLKFGTVVGLSYNWNVAVNSNLVVTGIELPHRAPRWEIGNGPGVASNYFLSHIADDHA